MSARMQLIQIGSPLLLLIILSACSSKSSADELTKDLQKVTSWAATADMVGDAWTHGNVPTAYTMKRRKIGSPQFSNEGGKATRQIYLPSILCHDVGH